MIIINTEAYYSFQLNVDKLKCTLLKQVNTLFIIYYFETTMKVFNTPDLNELGHIR
jgi:hypothetical protein